MAEDAVATAAEDAAAAEAEAVETETGTNKIHGRISRTTSNTEDTHQIHSGEADIPCDG